MLTQPLESHGHSPSQLQLVSRAFRRLSTTFEMFPCDCPRDCSLWHRWRFAAYLRMRSLWDTRSGSTGKGENKSRCSRKERPTRKGNSNTIGCSWWGTDDLVKVRTTLTSLIHRGRKQCFYRTSPTAQVAPQPILSPESGRSAFRASDVGCLRPHGGEVQILTKHISSRAKIWGT